MALPVDSIVEITLRGLCLNQRILNVFHYRVFTTSAKATVADEMLALTNAINTNAGTNLKAHILAILPDNYNMQQIVAQAIKLIRYRRSIRSATANGSSGADAETVNVQQSVTFQTDFSGRNQIGGKRVLMAPSHADQGLVNAIQFGKLVTFANTCVLPIVVADGGGVYSPVIMHRNQNPTTSVDITAAVAQNTVRVLRRRTVGLGE